MSILKTALCAASISVFGATAAFAQDHFDRRDSPYAAVLGDFVITDSARPADNGNGFELIFGMPLSHDKYSLEVMFFDNSIERTLDGNDDFQSGLVIDLVRNLGVYDWGEDSMLPRFSPFVLVGIGALQEDILAVKNLHAGLDVGVGTLVELPWWGLALRAEARYLGQFNDKSVPNEDYLGDVRFGLGLQIPLDRMFETPIRMEKDVPECGLAIVDPETGRKDCVADSDRDGVPDTLDRCPGTPAGMQVDPYGCAIAVADQDGDGVADSSDDCPNTRVGLQVNARGCAVAQSLVLKNVTFENDSSKLTADGRRTMNDVANTLKGQDNLLVEIAGHTDSVGSETYNLVLAKSRAESCRNFLIKHGVDASRLTAVGYGEFKPVASNETNDGRAKNRRVEFNLVIE